MPFVSVAEQLARLERITSADLFNAPTERVIAQGRLLLCALAVLAIPFHPTEPAHFAPYVEVMLMGYLAFSAVLVALTRYRFLSPQTCQAIHCVDVVVISVLLYLTNGAASPFFVFFTFALLAATLRWRWQAVIATAITLTGVVLVTGSHTVTLASAADSGLQAAIIRSSYLIVTGGLLAYVSAAYKRSRQRFAMLAPLPMSEVNSASIQQLLAQSAVVLEVQQILIVWEEAEEPFVNLTSWREGALQEVRRAAGTFGDLVNPALAGLVFLTGEVASEFVLLLKGPMRMKGLIIDLDLQKEFSIHGVASAPFLGTSCAGRVFIFNRSNWSDDHLLLTEIIASRAGIELDRRIAQRKNEEAVALRERIRLTRDLHDGVLQSLTAAGLQLNLAQVPVDQDHRSRLDLVRRLLTKEQRRIREFVDGIFPKPGAGKYAILDHDLRRQLEETAQYWDCTTSLSVAPPDAKVPESMAGELSLMLGEAIANAVRHGGASNIDIIMEKADGSLLVKIRDNGRGFDGQPRQNAGQGLAEASSLRNRVCALGGSLSVSNSPAGAELAIRCPVP